MLEVVCNELDKIADKGLTAGNLEHAFKLVDMYKDLMETEYWDVKKDYYRSEQGYSRTNHGGGHYQQEQYHDGYSERRRRDSMGRYSRNDSSYDGGNSYGDYSRNNNYSQRNHENYERYMDSKQSYRASQNSDCKQRLMTTLDEYMDSFTKQMEDMLKDSDCREEKETITRYLKKLQQIA